MVRLGDYIQLVSGFPFEATRFNDRREGMPVARIRDVVRSYTETYYDGVYPDEAQIRNGDLLVGIGQPPEVRHS